MVDNLLKYCVDCCNKQSIEELKTDAYYCHFANGDTPNGIVTDDTDATQCIAKGCYSGVEAYNQFEFSFERFEDILFE